MTSYLVYSLLNKSSILYRQNYNVKTWKLSAWWSYCYCLVVSLGISMLARSYGSKFFIMSTTSAEASRVGRQPYMISRFAAVIMQNLTGDHNYKSHKKDYSARGLFLLKDLFFDQPSGDS